jgi:hypothetical protein
LRRENEGDQSAQHVARVWELIRGHRAKMRSPSAPRYPLHTKVIDTDLKEHELNPFRIHDIKPHDKHRHWIVITLTGGAAIVVGIDTVIRAFKAHDKH